VAAIYYFWNNVAYARVKIGRL